MDTAKEKTTTKTKKNSFAQVDLSGVNKGEIAPSKKITETNAANALMAQYVRVFSTNQRQGNAKAKGRSEVAGTTKKIYKQKGTGKARHGSQRAPIFKGGGVVGGPLQKNYSLSFNKKQRKQALFTALTARISENAVVGLSIEADKAKMKTKTIASFLKKMKMDDKTVLFVLPVERMDSLVLSIRNIKKTTYTIATNMNAFEALSAGKIVFVNNAFEELEKHFTA